MSAPRVNRSDRLRDTSLNQDRSNSSDNNLVFSVSYLEEIEKLRTFVRGLEGDIKAITGIDRVIMAIRKLPAIGNLVVRNRKLSESSVESGVEDDTEFSQKCDGPGCMTCPLLSTTRTLSINGKNIKLDPNLNCKSSNVIYLAQCRICSAGEGTRKEDSYIGQTLQPVHRRMNGHRNKFNVEDHRKSALSSHCFDKHPDSFSLNNFILGVVKRVKAADLDRAENRLIDVYRTKLFGLNRISVVRD